MSEDAQLGARLAQRLASRRPTLFSRARTAAEDAGGRTPAPLPPIRKAGSGARARSPPARKPKNSDVELGSAPLPAYWEELTAADGTQYYYNSQTQATSWHRPEPTAAEKRAMATADDYTHLQAEYSEESQLPPDYEEHTDEDGTPYYYHVPTEHVSWARPVGGGGSEERHSNTGERPQRYSARV